MNNNTVFCFDLVRPIIHQIKMLRHNEPYGPIKSLLFEAEKQTDKLSYKLFLRAPVQDTEIILNNIKSHLNAVDRLSEDAELKKLTAIVCEAVMKASKTSDFPS